MRNSGSLRPDRMNTAAKEKLSCIMVKTVHPESMFSRNTKSGLFTEDNLRAIAL